MPDEMTVQLVLKWVEENEQALTQVQAQLAAITASQLAANAATAASNAAAAGGIPTWLAWGAAILGATVVLWPFVTLIGSAAIALTSFAVAGAGFVAIGALVAGAFAAMGAGVLVLGGGGGIGAAAALATTTTQLEAAKQALADFNALHTGAATGASTASLNAVAAARQALADFNALHSGALGGNAQLPEGPPLTLAQRQQQEDLQLRLSQTQAAAHGGAGGLTLAQRQQQEDLQLRLTTAQNAYNDALLRSQGPVAVLISQLNQMKDTLALQAAPLAALITQWVGGAIPAVTQMGQSLMSWFGDRLPGVLASAGNIIRDLTPDFLDFFKAFGGAMDHFAQNQLPWLLEAFGKLALQGAKGLLDNLGRLSDWFVKELPTLGKVVQDIFNWMGSAIQYVADHWANLNDFVVNKWPTTVKNAQEALKELQHWWDENGKKVEIFVGHLVDLMGWLNNLIGIAVKVSDFFNAMWDFIAGVGVGPPALLKDLQDIAGELGTIYGWTQKLQPGSGSSAHRPPPGNYQPASSPSSSGGGAGITVTNYINGAQDPAAVAREVARRLGGALAV